MEGPPAELLLVLIPLLLTKLYTQYAGWDCPHTGPRGRNHYPHFTDEQKKTQRGESTGSSLHSRELERPEIEANLVLTT